MKAKEIFAYLGKNWLRILPAALAFCWLQYPLKWMNASYLALNIFNILSIVFMIVGLVAVIASRKTAKKKEKSKRG